MTVAETIRFTQAFYENWDAQKAAALIERLGLPMNHRVKQLSRGNRARLCLVLALSYNPELILLDEPTSGLDPIVRRDFIENIISEIGSRGATVLFSSHLVEEIERVADHVGIIHEGRLIVSSEIDALKSSYKRIRFASDNSRHDLSGIPGILRVETADHEQIVTLQGWSGEIHHLLIQRDIAGLEVLPISLEEIFIELAGGPRERRLSA
jgi:ABC-2 type transport system ATP-binding protein